ncbi:stimulated by retinoic acid gene 8 protein homolog [Chanos chanos]|uniref:Stimulated by retinoic acid gene 8 protein homolog n=1 Tax=Chanos chanos TaxID=29144 RepID=A0A6J2WKG3_CHACN|nr:stimulated by retinoic acid gene 8 protein homolog [Chanos chanos]
MAEHGRIKRKGAADQQRERRRALQARHRATLASLFESLKNVVCPFINKTPAKWKILDHAKGFLHEKEAYLNQLLMLKETYFVNDDGPSTLEEVREQYKMLFSNCRVEVADAGGDSDSSQEVLSQEPEDELSQSQSFSLSLPDIQEFDGYLFFYRHTLELLLHGGILAPDQMGLPVVAEAIQGLWNSLPPERRTSVRPYTLEDNCLSWTLSTDNPLWPDTPQNPSQLYSQEVSGSSTFKEDMLQDAFDVVQRDMDIRSVDSQEIQPLHFGDGEKLKEIYNDVTCFIRSQMSEGLELTQELCQQADYDELFLKCTESFDEDL